MTVDRFGVPDNLLGPHHEDFFGLIGRITLLSALLESRAFSLLQALGNYAQNQNAHYTMSRIIKEAQKELEAHRAVIEPVERAAIDAFLSAASDCAKQRNVYVHSLWPVQAAGTYYGWTFAPRGTPTRSTSHVRLSREEVIADLNRIVSAIGLWDRAWTAVSGRWHIQVGERS